MNWTDTILDKAIGYLRDSNSVGEALAEMREDEDFTDEVTSAALRAAFNRNKLYAPSAYVGTETGGTSGKKETKSNKDKGELVEDIQIDFTKKQYHITHEFVKRSLSFDELEKACTLYADARPGLGHTATQVAMHFRNNGCEWAKPHFFSWLFKKIGQTKKDVPRAPHQIFKNAAEVAKHMRFISESLQKDEGQWEEIKSAKQLIRSLRRRVDELEDVKKLFNNVSGKDVQTYVNFDEDDYSAVHESGVWSSFVSDVHLGKTFKPLESSADYHEINIDIIKNRQVSYLNALRQASKRKYGNTIKRVLYQCLGDNYEALFANMRNGQHFTMDSLGFEQYMTGVELHCTLIEAHLEIFPKAQIKALFIGGNHDRLMADKAMSTELFVNAIMSERISKHFENEPRVDIICGAPVTSIMYGGVNFISQHGHLSNWNKASSRSNVLTAHESPDAVRGKILLSEGHYHETHYQSGTKHSYFRNSSWCGPDDFSVYHLNKTAPPECAFIECVGDMMLMHGPFKL